MRSATDLWPRLCTVFLALSAYTVYDDLILPETEKAEKTHPERRYVFYSIHKQYYDQLKYSAPSATESKNQKEDLLRKVK